MEDIKKEIMIEKYPRPIKIEATEKILNQMKKNICKIYKKGGWKGTGFFCQINYNKNKIPVIITNNHIIDENDIKKNNMIEISINNDNEIKTIILNDNRII